MNKLFSISISFLILIQSFGLSFNDLSQIDEFIEHAQYHNDQFDDNIFVFISKHYGELKAEHNKQHQEEKEDHEQLPFQHNSQMSSITAFVLNNYKVDIKTTDFSDFKSHHFFYQAPLSSLHSEGLLQPPRHS